MPDDWKERRPERFPTGRGIFSRPVKLSDEPLPKDFFCAFHQSRKSDLISGDHGAFDHIGEFPNVAGPGIVLQFLHIPFGHTPVGLVVLGREAFEKVDGQQGDVLFSFPEGRDVDGKYI
jgi:hypothetical protein